MQPRRTRFLRAIASLFGAVALLTSSAAAVSASDPADPGAAAEQADAKSENGTKGQEKAESKSENGSSASAAGQQKAEATSGNAPETNEPGAAEQPEEGDGESGPPAHAQNDPQDDGTDEEPGNDNAGDDAVVRADFGEDCTSVTVTSTKDLSNVVLDFEDGEKKYDGLSGHEDSFSSDRVIVGVWVKSGNNGADTPPGYGEYLPSDCEPADETPPGDDDAGDGSGDTPGDGEGDTGETGGDGDGDNGDTGDGDDQPEATTTPDEGTDVEVGGDEEVADEEDEGTVGTPVTPEMPETPNQPGNPNQPETPDQPEVQPDTETADQQPVVRGSTVSREVGQLPRTGPDSAIALVPYALALLLLGFGLQRTGRRLARTEA